jgi:putative transposase
MTRQKPTVAGLRRHIEHECQGKGLPTPSIKSLRVRIDRQKRKALVKSRDGARAADDQFRPVVGQYVSEYALQVTQIDHTKVDVIVVDDLMRRPLGRPWLTLIIDLASRMVAGFHLTMEAPSAISVAMALRHAVLPKGAWLAERGIEAPWPAAGIPEVLHMDNGKDFHSRALERGCGEYGIARHYRPPATPHFGGHIERLIGTMMGAVHLLPGTTFSNTVEKGDYDAGNTAVMTLPELETWLAIQIVGVYHASLHRAIQVPPAAAWEDAVARRPAPLRLPADTERFLFDFLPFEHRKVRRDGIRLFNIHYWDNILSAWVGELDQPMPVKYDPRDLSRVFLRAPDGKHWPIRYRDLGRPRITLWEHREATRTLRERGRRAVDEVMIFEAIEAQRMLVAEAARRTKAARQAAQRTASALASARERDEPAAVASPRAQLPDSATERSDRPGGADESAGPAAAPVLPYDVEEWS